MKKLKTFFGLPKKVIFCKKCCISNQRPNSSVEFLHNIKSKKKQFQQIKKASLILGNFLELKTKLILKIEKNLFYYFQKNTEVIKKMFMTVLYQAVVVKIAALLRMYLSINTE